MRFWRSDGPDVATHTTRCEFMLRTQGTEYGWDKISHEVVSSPEFSRPSPIASFRTGVVPAPPEPERDARAGI